MLLRYGFGWCSVGRRILFEDGPRRIISRRPLIILLYAVHDFALGLFFRQSAYLALPANDARPLATALISTCAYLLSWGSSAVEFGLEDLDLVVPLHDHCLLLLAFIDLFLQLIFH